MSSITMEKRIGIGLVGVGRHGSRYARHLLHDLPEARLVAVCRRNAEEGFLSPGVKVYGDYRAMMADPLVDAVAVVTAPSLCPAVCVAAASAGKPMLVEKPLALTGRDARTIVEAAGRARVVLMTAQTMRFDSTVLKAKELLEGIGALRHAILISHIETKPNVMVDPLKVAVIPAGALLELGVHLFDLVRFFTGDEVLEVRCVLEPDMWGVSDVKAEVELRTNGGVSCRLDIARVESHRLGLMQWRGSKGVVEADWVNRTVLRSCEGGDAENWAVEAQPTVLATLRAFVHALRIGQPPPITGIDGTRAVELADACYRSALNGSRWVLATASD